MFTTQGEAAQEALFDLTADHEGDAASDPFTVANALRDLRWIRDQADRGIEAQVAILREHGDSWTTIGLLLRVSKQAAQQRYGA